MRRFFLRQWCQLYRHVATPGCLDVTQRHLLGLLCRVVVYCIACHHTICHSLVLCIQLSSSGAPNIECSDTVLQAAQAEAERQNDVEEQEQWRKRIFRYLDWLFRRDANAGADFAGLQVRSSWTMCKRGFLHQPL